MIHKIQAPFFKRLETLYAQMDTAWEKAAAHYGFVCRGCANSCCATEFYHYTYIEIHYLLKGVETLKAPMIKTIREKAKAACTAIAEAKATGQPVRVMCPLNNNGLCRLYKYRPMICRLHGIPHELKKPEATPVRHPGCTDGTPLFNAGTYYRFDRTPIYAEMAKLEMEYRSSTDNQARIRQTIAKIIASS